MKKYQILAGILPLLFFASTALAEVKTDTALKKVSVVTQDDAKMLIKLLKKGSNSLRFEARDPLVSIQCSEEPKEECSIITERAGLRADAAKALTAALGGKSFNSQDGKLSITCGLAVLFPENDGQEFRRDVPFCVLIQR